MGKSAGANMAYTPGFRYDLFISYPTVAEGWATQFHEDLKTEMWLAAATGLKIYFAPESWVLTENSDAMLDAARNSAIFVAILTPDSVNNSNRFLRKEMEAFQQSSPLKLRFCPIPLAPIDSAQLARAMPSGNPDAFWNANLAFYYLKGGSPVRFPQNGEQYKEAIQKVAWQLRNRLEKIRSGGEEVASKGPFAGMTVYVAQDAPGSTVAKESQDVRSLLLNDGVSVVPSAPSHGDAATAGEEFETAENAILFVQVFSAEEVDHAKAQLETFKSRKSGKSFPVLQWRKKFKENIDAAVLQALEREDREFCEGAQTGLLEDFKVQIRSKLAEIKAAQERPPLPPPPPEQPYIYITADTPDLPLARKLQETARERTEGTVAVIMNEDETQRREDFESNLMVASGVVFLHGNATRRFVELWLNEFVKKTRLLKLHPKIAALYQAPPEKTEEQLPARPIKLSVVGSQKEFTVTGIETICAELYGDRA
jgi:hypothetical protein